MGSSALAKSLLRFVAAVLSSGAIAAVAACASPGQSAANASCDCEMCSAGDRQSRLADAAENQQKADNLGCGGPYDDYRSCLNDNSTCVAGHYETNHDACGLQKAVLCRCSQKYC